MERFEEQGGSLERDILTPSNVNDLASDVRHDFVLTEDGAFRCAARVPGRPDAGHALLAENGREFKNVRVRVAGELRVIRNSEGEIVALLVACSSGHFKPHFKDVDRMVPVLRALGAPEARLILGGGPSDVSSIVKEIAKKCDLGDPTPFLQCSLSAARKGMGQSEETAFASWPERHRRRRLSNSIAISNDRFLSS